MAVVRGAIVVDKPIYPTNQALHLFIIIYSHNNSLRHHSIIIRSLPEMIAVVLVEAVPWKDRR